MRRIKDKPLAAGKIRGIGRQVGIASLLRDGLLQIVGIPPCQLTRDGESKQANKEGRKEKRKKVSMSNNTMPQKPWCHTTPSPWENRVRESSWLKRTQLTPPRCACQHMRKLCVPTSFFFQGNAKKKKEKKKEKRDQ